MSYDIYLLPLQPTDDLNEAMELLDTLERRNPDYSYDFDARDAVKEIVKLDSRYHEFEKDYAEMARYERITEEEARRRHDWIELNGETDEGLLLAQFIFNCHHIVIHCSDGTSADELDQFVLALCAATGCAAVDPQQEIVLRLQADGTLA